MSLVLVAGCTRNLPPATQAVVEETGSAVAEEEPATSVAATVEIEDRAAEPIAPTSEQTFEDGLPLAARVNGQPIFLDVYQKQVELFKQTLIAQGVDLESNEGQASLGQVQRQVLEALIDQAILEQQAQTLGLSITEDALEAKAQESVQQGQGQEQFEVWLQANDLTYDEFKETLHFQLIANQLFEQITADIPAVAEQIELRHILVTDVPTAQMIIEQLKVGADFGTLAQTYSLDDSNREAGGNLGWFPRQAGLIPPEVEGFAFDLQQNEVSGPIQSSLGYHIIQLTNREAERPLKIELLQAMRERQFADWLQMQRDVSVIEKFVAQ